MIPLLLNAHTAALVNAGVLQDQARCLRDENCWNILTENGYIQEVECTPKGLLITPLSDPHGIASVFNTAFDMVFTREKDDSGLYQWVSTWSIAGTLEQEARSFQVYILANESLDFTGTSVHIPLAQQ